MPLAETSDVPLFLLLPLASSLIYVWGALSMKRTAQNGAGVWRTTFASNIATALIFAPLCLVPVLTPPVTGETPLWQPALIGLAFIVGQVCAMYALSRGDVSVATPVLGTKVIFVAFFDWLILGTRLGTAIWISAAMSAAGIGLLNGGQKASRRHLLATTTAALCAAVCYAIFDIMVRRWAPAWGTGRLLPLVFLFSAVGSLALVPLFEGPMLKLPKPAIGPLLVGSFMIALQSALLVPTFAVFGQVTKINVVYNSRGLWSVIAVWLVGHWWGNKEMSSGNGVVKWRIAGAVLMLSAIVLAVTS